MYKTPPKRKFLLQRFAVYTAMTIVVVGTTWVLFFVMLGYRFNSSEGEFEQGGLAQFVTRPTGASVTVGSAHLSAETPSKITLNPGSYDVKMELNGYRPWTKDVSIRAGQVLWLNSVRFVPKDPKVETAAALSGFGSMTSRDKGNTVAVIEKPGAPQLSLFDIGGQKVSRRNVVLPTGTFTEGKKHSFTLLQMATNDRFILVQHDYDGKREIIAADMREPARTFALKVGDDTLNSVRFDPRSADRIFGRTSAGGLYTVNLPDRDISELLATNVESFSFVSDQLVLYVVRDAKQGTATVKARRLGSDSVYTLHTAKTQGAVLAAGGYYYSDLYVATAVGTTLTLLQTPDVPSDGVLDKKERKVVSQIVLKEQPRTLSMKGSDRLVLAEQTDGVTLYDIELAEATTTEYVGENKVTSPVRWLDEYHYWYRGDDKLAMSEFDGSNVHQLATIEASSDAVLSMSGRYLYSVGTDDKGALRLQRTVMILQ